MKKIISFVVMATILCLTSSQVNAPKINQQPVRMLKATMSEKTWQTLLYVIDRSDVNHLLVAGVRDSLLRQLNDSTINPLK